MPELVVKRPRSLGGRERSPSQLQVPFTKALRPSSSIRVFDCSHQVVAACAFTADDTSRADRVRFPVRFAVVVRHGPGRTGEYAHTRQRLLRGVGFVAGMEDSVVPGLGSRRMRQILKACGA